MRPAVKRKHLITRDCKKWLVVVGGDVDISIFRALKSVKHLDGPYVLHIINLSHCITNKLTESRKEEFLKICSNYFSFVVIIAGA